MVKNPNLFRSYARIADHPRCCLIATAQLEFSITSGFACFIDVQNICYFVRERVGSPGKNVSILWIVALQLNELVVPIFIAILTVFLCHAQVM